METKQNTVQEFEVVCKQIKDLRDEYDRKKIELDEIDTRLSATEMQAKAMLEVEEKSKYVSESGTIYTAVHSSVAIPKGDNKQQFMQYLRDINLFDEVVTVNSQWLNKHYREALETASDPVLFGIPGLDKPYTEVRLKFMKGK